MDGGKRGPPYLLRVVRMDEVESKKIIGGDEDRKNAKKKRKKYLRYIGIILVLAGIAVVAYPLSTFVVTNRAQDTLRSDWNKVLEKAAKNESDEKDTKEKWEPVPAGTALFKLQIPKIGVDAIVVEGTDRETLKKGPGHITKTVYPGELGVCVISGHRTTYGAAFFRLDNLEKGDELIIETAAKKYTYIVFEKMVVYPDETEFIDETPGYVLALTTCTPVYSARQRLVILARLK